MELPLVKRTKEENSKLVANENTREILRCIAGVYPIRSLVWDQAATLSSVLEAKTTADLDSTAESLKSKCKVLYNFLQFATEDFRNLVPDQFKPVLKTIVSVADTTKNPADRPERKVPFYFFVLHSTLTKNVVLCTRTWQQVEPELRSQAWAEFDFKSDDSGVHWSDFDGCLHEDYHRQRQSVLVANNVMPIIDEWCRCEGCWCRRESCAHYYLDSMHAPFNRIVHEDYKVLLFSIDDSSTSGMVCNKAPKTRGITEADKYQLVVVLFFVVVLVIVRIIVIIIICTFTLRKKKTR
jgi:hypothetical protein